MTISAERREELLQVLPQPGDTVGFILPDGTDMSCSELRALLSDSAWRERVESTLREIERFGHNEGHGCGYSCADMAQRAILDTGRGGNES